MQCAGSEEDILDDVTMNIGEAEIPALVAISEFPVIDAHQVENGGIEVMDMHGAGSPVFFSWLRIESISIGVGDIISVVIGAAVGDTWADSATGHPDSEAAGMVVAAIIFPCQSALAIGGAAEFAAPDHEGIVEHAPLFEILYQSGTSLVDVMALIAVFGGEVVVSIPSAVENLNIPHAALS